MVKHASFYRFQLYNYTRGRLMIDMRDIKRGDKATASITGNPDKVQWRFWWINNGDEPITSRIHWTFREKIYGKDWSDWGTKINDVTIPLNPGVDAELTQDDYLPMKEYNGKPVWQYYEMLIQLYVNGNLTDQLRIFIDNDNLTITVTNERPTPTEVSVSIYNGLDKDITLTWTGDSKILPPKSYTIITTFEGDTITTSQGIFKETGTNKLLVKAEHEGKVFHVVPPGMRMEQNILEEPQIVIMGGING